ncbi:hypothetical protein EGR_10219 [Echinococcus granulosus]|uniref:Uncharacterized protein n=1 Tax=Echinococcus granulosus TaxID=6210 RepID=W6UN00_ECHGR|nr:hypothetical protein EGR_10219 [Echinococcus granulosus]EUB54909.1 hypothetical protein EGR_10219 [Echinococcus granulosus]
MYFTEDATVNPAWGVEDRTTVVRDSQSFVSCSPLNGRPLTDSSNVNSGHPMVSDGDVMEVYSIRRVATATSLLALPFLTII